MRLGIIGGSLLLVLGFALAGPAAAQQTSTDDLKKDIESLREMLKTIQKDIQDIKASMARLPGPSSPVGMVVDLADDPVRGERTAKVTLVEVSDYQCRFCARYFKDTYPQLDAEYIKTGKVRSVFLNLPLEAIHKSALGAAKAAKCAGDEGKYWEMHDQLLANQKTLEPWNAHAEAIGLDLKAFEQCLASGRHDAAIRRDMAEAQKLSITGTPGFLIGRTEPNSSKLKVLAVLRGARPFEDFKREIEKQLADADKSAVIGESAKK